MRTVQSKGGRRGGFTLTEVMVASSLSALVAAGAFSAFSVASRSALAGRSQVQFNDAARLVSQKLVEYVEEGRTVGVATPNALDIIMLDLRNAQIRLVDGDGNPGTVTDNKLVYDPDVNVSGNEKTLCNYVSSIGTNDLFSIVAVSPSAARFCFHIGDGTNVTDASFSGTGPGYQGIEVRISATPRNLQHWYDH